MKTLALFAAVVVGLSQPAPAVAADPGSFTSDLNLALKVADRYWAARIPGFTPVSRLVPYHGDGEVYCGTQPIPSNNAAYCPIGDFIAYDVDWAAQVDADLGDAFVFYLLGHEYGHGIQARLGIQYQYTIDQEMQADCMSGAYIGDSIKDGDLRLEDGDLDELRRGLFSVGDPPDQPWFQEGSHGSPEQRTDAFFSGYALSLLACSL